MRKIMQKIILVLAVFLACAILLSAQTKDRYALVIGNGRYAELGELKNTRNDARDMAEALKDLGFEVTSLIDADLIAMENAVSRFTITLAASPNAIGLFYFAGHGVQSNGANYLIPSDARIPEESYLKMRALPLQVVLEDLQKARNKLNIVILDACRDNPYSWGRSGSRGLTVVSYQPPGSIIVYATSAGSTALEGTGRNGVFTGELLKHLKTPGIDVMEVFTRAGASVQQVTNGRQNPAIYTQFFEKAYFVSAAAQKSYGSIAATVQTGGTLVLDGRVWGNVASGSTVILNEVDAGQHELRMEYPSGHVEQKSIEVLKDRQAKISFDRKFLQVRYDSNGATSGKAPVDETNYVPGELIIARANTGSLEKTGYSFAGWNTKPDGTGISYQPGDIIAMRGADATLFAQWKETASFRPQTGWIDFSNVPPNTDIYLDGEYLKAYQNIIGHLMLNRFKRGIIKSSWHTGILFLWRIRFMKSSKFLQATLSNHEKV